MKPVSAVPGDFTPLAPLRVLDTRDFANSAMQPGETKWFNIASAAGLDPSAVSAVAINITVTNPSTAGYVSVWPGDQSAPTASALNFSAGQTIANSIIVGTSGDGAIKIHNPFGNTDVVLDVTGWFSNASSFSAVQPHRAMDTRAGIGGLTMGPGESRALSVTGQGNVPSSGVEAVAINLTAVNPATNGYITVWPSDSSKPTASAINFVGGDIVANALIVEVAADGTIALFNSAGTTDVVVDVMGWFSANDEYVGVQPTRVADTRVSQGGGALAPGESRVFDLTGALPAGALAASVNLTIVAPASAGHLTVWPADQSKPLASVLNFAAFDVRANGVVVGLDPSGRLMIENASQWTHLLIDVTGYFGEVSAQPPTPTTTPTPTTQPPGPGVVSRAAGTGVVGSPVSGQPATSTPLLFPHEVATDNNGDLYISDFFTHQVAKVDRFSGILTIVAGNGFQGYSGDGGQATSAQLNNPVALAFDSSNNLYIADHTNHVVRRVDAFSGIITTVAGNGTAGDSGDGGPATWAQLDIPEAVAVYGQWLYIGDFESDKVRRVNLSTGTIDTWAGNGIRFGTKIDGPSATAGIVPTPAALATDNAGNLYISTLWRKEIRKVAPDGSISTIAGTGSGGFSGDGGPATSATIDTVDGLDIDSSGRLILGDRANCRIRRIDLNTGIISTVVGNGTCGNSGDGLASLQASIDIDGVAAGADGEIYFAQPGDHVVRRATP